MSWSTAITVNDVLQPSGVRFVLPNADGTRTIFYGSGFTYDSGGLPTGGTITRIDRFAPGTGVLERITGVTPGESVGSAQDFTAILTPYLALRAQISWHDTIGANAIIETEGRLRLQNADGTFTDVIGCGLSSPSSGTVSQVRHLDSNGRLLETVTLANVNLGLLATALNDEALSQSLYQTFMTATGVRVSAIAPGSEASIFEWGFVSGGAGDDVLVGYPSTVPAGPRGVDYGHSPNSVRVDLESGTATGQGRDTLVRINDVLGSQYGDSMTGNSLANLLVGGEGDDFLAGRDGDDVLLGGAGDNSLSGEAGNDSINGGAGIDSAGFSSFSGVRVDLRVSTAQDTGEGIDTFTSIENIRGSQGNDTIIGSAGRNELFGSSGNDRQYGVAGDDLLIGGLGNDLLNGGPGNDVLEGSSGVDVLHGGAGMDRFDFADFRIAAGRVTASRDFVRNFSHADDSIALLAWQLPVIADFDSWTNAEKADAFFVVGQGVADAEDRFIYDPATGRLYFDMDGTGSALAVEFAILLNKPVDLDYTDFIVI